MGVAFGGVPGRGVVAPDIVCLALSSNDLNVEAILRFDGFANVDVPLEGDAEFFVDMVGWWGVGLIRSALILSDLPGRNLPYT